ncbi:uncharacterized protein L969DRAFT_92860 [Mixia osmundae IAM 14324]|uniref:Uncharacterized protein n=1 Tax=Mixia osmundae (strain CBS 9802 / IAM 14324 / JCM 22182 / KY 12970) TaxID=764103 RepID=G7DYS6_MIXOS|nr:uncharacterized protein L969DRAFT_92860 [Mixia osmundae IAM 14324]KEI41634.1 hypothetical protein L969DRAFT_92860 [Mixia osmundae IAM 14324]GAA95736.1 hypothetical protein E5Q_02393 [Mixia osmundae IAM 14324]
MDFSISHRHPGSLLITLAYAGHLLSVKVANKFLVHRLSILQNTGDAVTVSLTNIERPTDPGWVDCCSHIQRWHIKFEAWYDSATMVTEYSALYCYPSEASFYMNTCTRKILREIMPETVTQCSCPLNEVVNPAAGAYGAKIGWKGYEFRSSPDSTSSLRVRGVPMEEIASLA